MLIKVAINSNYAISRITTTKTGTTIMMMMMMENEKRNRNRSLLSGFALTHENWLHWHYVASHMDMEHALVDWECRDWPCGVYQPRRATPVWHPERAHCHMRSHGDSRQMDRDPFWPAVDHAGSVFVVRRCKPARRKEQRERERGVNVIQHV